MTLILPHEMSRYNEKLPEQTFQSTYAFSERSHNNAYCHDSGSTKPFVTELLHPSVSLTLSYTS